jgi:predicted nucleotidyltransferase
MTKRAATTARRPSLSPGSSFPEPPQEVHDAVDALIERLGAGLSAVYWHGSWVRGEQTAASDHDLIIVLRQVNDELMLGIQDVFRERPGWSTFIKSEQELRQYPVTGRLQFQFGLVPLYGEIVAPPLSTSGLAEDIRVLATNIQHECRYLVVHGTRKVHVGFPAELLRVRNAGWMYYQAKLAVLALKARELLLGRSYPETRGALRGRLTDEDELAVVDTVDRWPDLRIMFEADVTPLALRLDSLMRKLVAELDSGAIK